MILKDFIMTCNFTLDPVNGFHALHFAILYRYFSLRFRYVKSLTSDWYSVSFFATETEYKWQATHGDQGMSCFLPRLSAIRVV